MIRATPMIHVPDVAATAEWYRAIGFDVIELGAECAGEDSTFALLGCGDTRVMLSAGGKPSDAERREVDLYVDVEDVAATRAVIGDRADIVEEVHDTFYGAREFIVRDYNRFWITFGQHPA
jgi:hypothetical protein